VEFIDRFFSVAVDYAWGWPLIVLLVGGGLYLTIRSRFIPFLAFRHAIDILRGKYDDPNDPGEISHLQALSTAISATVGISNIGGVAIAITQGGPGAVFWMWVVAVVGMTTKFFTCTLACMYRKTDAEGTPQGGPMYFIEVGLGPRFRPLAVFFSVCGLVGCLCLFQVNQLAEVLDYNYGVNRLLTGVLTAIVVGAVVLGGIQRIGRVSEKLVPVMCAIYILASLCIIVMRIQMLPDILWRIISDAFTGNAVAGGMVGSVIVIGVKRAAFSNEAGIGTAPMAHGAAKTDEPVREGLVAMLGPFIDTIVICSMTAFVILSSEHTEAVGFDDQTLQGVSLTSQAFESALGTPGVIVVTVSALLFSVSTMIGYSYYGKKCLSYLIGQRHGQYYNVFYIATLVLGAVWSADTVINVLDTAFAMMAFPNMIATLLLAPHVMAATKDYFNRCNVV
jgi:AGCS family alanine or glycine:cation symporter